MKTIILYTRRNVGLMVLSYLVAKWYKVYVISSDENVLWLANQLGITIIEIEYLAEGTFDLFLCVHGEKIISNHYLNMGAFVNIHPTHYNGHNPVKKFIKNKDTVGSLRAMYMIEKVDEGELIAEEKFETGICHEYADYYNIALPYYPRIISKVLEKIL